ncbi:signal recognition particle-docking protein FtsY [archaeon]|nr:signal recognition particle-docking protein FtsY [archaeon]
MFGKLKEKLKSWIKSSSEKIEEEAEVVEKPVKTSKGKKEGKKKEVKEVKEKKEKSKKVEKKEDSNKKVKASKKDAVEILSEKSGEEIVEVLEEDKSPSEVVEKLKEVKEEEVEKESREFDKAVESAKSEEGKEVPSKFNVGTQKYEPDIEEIREEVEVDKEEPKNKGGFFSRVKSQFSYKIGGEEFEEIFDDLEMLLLENNVALEVVEDLRKKLSEKLVGKEINKKSLEDEIKEELKNSLNEILIEPDNPLDFVKMKKEKPFVILFFGINGTGKTTSIAKMTHFLKKAGMSVVLAAGDTFRAASIEQISEHAKKLEVPLIKHGYESDPAAVGFDAIKYAKAHGVDVVLIDTAGRMHTKSNLMSEMEKIVRVTNPDLKIFVAESIAGNDAVEQARSFSDSVGMDGSILSKADVDEKGGTVISVSHATGKPIFYLGVGQEYEDLRLFNKVEFIENLGL